ncbi:CD4-1 molecule isoform X2 [Triplophysa rosa]|uniref:CD4-like protein n=1 Tax=Triplophysa rosa TaxID=992332 RepID=A0A9W7WQ45_TRIRA|nr:CD4-1 molecule isoform X2 [Triplophysa rosa]KAI7806269.1 CD4-like protein [Triplophysa rosa]
MTLCWILIFLTFQFLKAEETEEEIYAQAGGTVTLQRETYAGTVKDSPDGTSKIYVNWVRGSEQTPFISRNPHGGIQGKEKTRFSFLPNFSLQISPVEESDFGVIHCEQHLLTKMYTKRYRLRRVTVPKVQAVIVGDTLFLKCELEKSSFSYSFTVKWVPPKSSNCKLDIPYTNGDISVSNVPMCASGDWTCNVKYNRREATAKTTVYVIDLAPAPSKPIYTAVNNTVNIPCSLSSDIPWTLLNESGLQGGSWTFTPQGNENQQPLLSLIVGPQTKWNVTKGAQIAVRERTLTDKDLSILKLPVSEKIRGEYTCTLVFKRKTFSRKVKVEVLQVSSTANSSLNEGQMVNLSCSLGPHTITPEVNWTCRSCSTHPFLRSTPQPANLFFPVRMEDNGEWRCELWNNQEKLTSVKFSLKVVKVPVDIWVCVAISSGVVVFILLLVVIIIGIRRHKQMVMFRRRKTKFCCCKSPEPKGFYKT